MLDRPLRTAEFLVVDTETNGLAGDACELTEVGAVLVGGGELHDRWETLVGVRTPLSRGIQRFTGITQAMVDAAPPAEATLPELADLLGDRVLVAHNASFDRRVLRQAFDRAGVAWPDPPVLCTVALARRLHPLARQRRLARAGRVARRRGRGDPPRARRRRDVRPRPVRAVPAAVRARGDDRRRARAAARARGPGARARARPTAGARTRGARRRLPALDGLPDEPGVYLVRNAEGQVLYVGKSVAVRTRARAHFQPSATEGSWVAQAETVDYETTRSELGALLLEGRLIRRHRPPGNVRRKHVDGYVYLRCRLDIAFPVLEVAPAPAPGLGVSVGPLRGRAPAVELLEQLNSLFGLRHCGRAPPAARAARRRTARWGAACRPAWATSTPTSTAAGSTRRSRSSPARATAGPRCWPTSTTRCAAAADRQQFERAGWLRRRRERLAWLLDVLGGAVAATHARPRLVLAEHPRGGRFDALWLVGGRVVDWAPVDPPADLDDLARRTADALRHDGRPGGTASLTPDDVDEARLVVDVAGARRGGRRGHARPAPGAVAGAPGRLPAAAAAAGDAPPAPRAA